MGLMFEVAEGGFLDIDVRIEGKWKLLIQNIQRNGGSAKKEAMGPVLYFYPKFKIFDRT